MLLFVPKHLDKAIIEDDLRRPVGRIGCIMGVEFHDSEMLVRPHGDIRNCAELREEVTNCVLGETLLRYVLYDDRRSLGILDRSIGGEWGLSTTPAAAAGFTP